MKSEIENPNRQRGQNIFVRILAFINIYFDHCTNPHYHGAIKSTDMKAWQDISPPLAFLKGIRHGTILAVPKKIVEPIQKY